MYRYFAKEWWSIGEHINQKKVKSLRPWIFSEMGCCANVRGVRQLLQVIGPGTNASGILEQVDADEACRP